MKQLPKLIKAINNHQWNGGWLTDLSRETGISRSALWSLKNMKKVKYRKQTLDVLYNYFQMEYDTFYKENMKKRHPPTFAVIWNIMRLKRLEAHRAMEDVAKLIKGSVRELYRIEAWDSLPSYRSRYMTELLELYEFTEEERNTIMRWIAIVKDLIKMNNKYDSDNQTDDSLKCHWKKTVVKI
jgi:transcriptional regulator with XRE-family HTH domain